MIHKIQFYGINDSRIQKLFIVISKITTNIPTYLIFDNWQGTFKLDEFVN